MKEGRGRSDAGGNFLISKQLDNWYFELNTLLEDGTSLYNNGNYHGRYMEQQKNVAYLRPVIAWSPTEEFTVSAAMEANVVKMLMAIPIIGEFCRSVQSFRLWY